MTVAGICELFDQYVIVDKQEQLNSECISKSANIYCDGEYDYSIDEISGLIIINNIHDANYLVFITEFDQTCLHIYKYTPATKLAEVATDLNKLKDTIIHESHNVSHKHTNEITVHSEASKDEHLIDINNFKCPGCNEVFVFSKPNPNADTIIARCNKCGLEYALIPSKFYIIKAKKEIYSNNDNARNLSALLNKEDNKK